MLHQHCVYIYFLCEVCVMSEIHSAITIYGMFVLCHKTNVFLHQQQSTSNVVVVTQPQPTATVVTYQRRYYGTGDRGMALAIVSTIIACIFCCWISLICTLFAIFFAASVSLSQVMRLLI